MAWVSSGRRSVCFRRSPCWFLRRGKGAVGGGVLRESRCLGRRQHGTQRNPREARSRQGTHARPSVRAASWPPETHGRGRDELRGAGQRSAPASGTDGRGRHQGSPRVAVRCRVPVRVASHLRPVCCEPQGRGGLCARDSATARRRAKKYCKGGCAARAGARVACAHQGDL